MTRKILGFILFLIALTSPSVSEGKEIGLLDGGKTLGEWLLKE